MSTVYLESCPLEHTVLLVSCPRSHPVWPVILVSAPHARPFRTVFVCVLSACVPSHVCLAREMNYFIYNMMNSLSHSPLHMEEFDPFIKKPTCLTQL